MWRLNKKQVLALWVGFSAIVILLLFPPPGDGQRDWPIFVYSTHEVMGKRQPDGRIVTQYGWQRPGLADRVRLPIIAICVLTGGAVILLASPTFKGYPNDPSYRTGFRDPTRPGTHNHRKR